MCFGSPEDDSGQRAAEAERKRRQRIEQGTAAIDQAFAGFTPEYFAGLEKSYSDYATPQLEEDYADAKKKLAFALARAGLTSSTAGADKFKKIKSQYDEYGVDLTGRATDFGNQARKDTESSRAELLAQLTATEDPAAASQAALRQAELLSRPPTFNPIDPFIFDIATGLENLSAQQGYSGLIKSPLFKSSGGKSGVQYVS